MLKFSYEIYNNKNLIIFGNLPYNVSTQVLAKWIKIGNLDGFVKIYLMFGRKLQIELLQKQILKVMEDYLYFQIGS